MSDSPNPLAPIPNAPAVTLEELAAEHQSLRTALHVTMVMIIVLTASLFVFFLRELSLARRQIAELTQGIAEYEKTAVPVMEDFRGKLQAFARVHPDFAPVYTKYFGTNAAPLGQSPAKAQPLATNNGPVRLPPPR
jgi:hypothetical protein